MGARAKGSWAQALPHERYRMGSEPGHDAGKSAPPAEIGALLRQAVAFHRAGMLAEAAPFYNQVLDRAPDHRDALHFLGVLSHQQGDNEAAVALMRRALALGDDDPAVHANLDIALFQQGQVDDAIAQYRAALGTRPSYAEAHFNLAAALRRQGALEAALAAYQA